MLLIKNHISKVLFCLYSLIVLSIWSFSSSALAATPITNNINSNDLTPVNRANKVLIVISSDKHGYWLPEVLEPYQLLQSAGYTIDIASPKGGEGTSRGNVNLSNKQKKWLKQSDLNAKLIQTIPVSTVNSPDYQAVYFAGGAGPMFDLIDNKHAQRITREIYEAGGIISADCHGPAALLNVFLSNGKRLIENRKITAKANIEEGRWARNNYPFLLEDKYKALGAEYIALGKNQPNVVVDGRLITGQNPASAIPMTKRLLEQLANNLN